jgi:AraC family transcriptional regulator of arabinose operon
MFRAGVDVLWIARYDYRKGWALRPHCHDYFQLIHFLSGRGILRIAGRQHVIHGGETLLVKPGEVHSLRADSLVCTFDVKFRVAAKRFADLLKTAPALVHWNEPGLVARFENIRQEGERKRHYYREICSAQLQEILYRFLRQHDGTDAPAHPEITPEVPTLDELLQKATSYLRANLGRQLTVREIARELGVSDRLLRMHFQRSLGISPLEHLHAFRIAHAKSLIEFSGYSLKEIARLSGFQNVQHFSRVFKQVANLTPAAWRDEFLQGVRRDVVINPMFSNQNWTTRTSA